MFKNPVVDLSLSQSCVYAHEFREKNLMKKPILMNKNPMVLPKQLCLLCIFDLFVCVLPSLG